MESNGDKRIVAAVRTVRDDRVFAAVRAARDAYAALHASESATARPRRNSSRGR